MTRLVTKQQLNELGEEIFEMLKTTNTQFNIPKIFDGIKELNDLSRFEPMFGYKNEETGKLTALSDYKDSEEIMNYIKGFFKFLQSHRHFSKLQPEIELTEEETSLLDVGEEQITRNHIIKQGFIFCKLILNHVRVSIQFPVQKVSKSRSKSAGVTRRTLPKEDDYSNVQPRIQMSKVKTEVQKTRQNPRTFNIQDELDYEEKEQPSFNLSEKENGLFNTERGRFCKQPNVRTVSPPEVQTNSKVVFTNKNLGTKIQKQVTITKDLNVSQISQKDDIYDNFDDQHENEELQKQLESDAAEDQLHQSKQQQQRPVRKFNNSNF